MDQKVYVYFFQKYRKLKIDTMFLNFFLLFCVYNAPGLLNSPLLCPNQDRKHSSIKRQKNSTKKLIQGLDITQWLRAPAALSCRESRFNSQDPHGNHL